VRSLSKRNAVLAFAIVAPFHRASGYGNRLPEPVRPPGLN